MGQDIVSSKHLAFMEMSRFPVLEIEYSTILVFQAFLS